MQEKTTVSADLQGIQEENQLLISKLQRLAAARRARSSTSFGADLQPEAHPGRMSDKLESSTEHSIESGLDSSLIQAQNFTSFSPNMLTDEHHGFIQFIQRTMCRRMFPTAVAAARSTVQRRICARLCRRLAWQWSQSPCIALEVNMAWTSHQDRQEKGNLASKYLPLEFLGLQNSIRAKRNKADHSAKQTLYRQFF